MRPMGTAGEVVGGGNLMEKQSMDLEHAKEAWDEWEIQLLILLSLSLQVLLFFTADMRRRSASRVLGTVLWLAYLSADTVAIFVLGHLAVHVRGPSHELMLFWAPFVLIHLGGQDTITAFSKQDNELWTRHLLNLVSQVAVAGYVVSRSSWPDAKLRAAMVLMFIHGFLKYTGRIICLYSASPKSLGSSSLGALSEKIQNLQLLARDQTRAHPIWQWFVAMFVPDVSWEYIRRNPPSLQADDIMSADAPFNYVGIIAVADELPDILEAYQSSPHRCYAYQYMAAILVQSYKYLYTKAPLLDHVVQFFDCTTSVVDSDELFYKISILAHAVFNLSTTVVALALFASAEKESHRHTREDIIVSYLLLLGDLLLDLLPAFTSIVVCFVRERIGFRPPWSSRKAEWALFCTSLISCIIPKGWQTTKQWSEEIAQYSMIKRYTSVQGYCSCMPASLRTWIGERFESFDLTRTPVTDDLKLLVLDKLLLQSRRKEWDCSFRGEIALGKWMDRRLHVVPAPERSSGYDALHESISSRVDFPTSILIWHIATDICYFSEDKDRQSSDETKMKKTTTSRQLSLYIMYLVFKCDVMLTRVSRLAHKRAHEGLTEFLISDHEQSPQVNYLDEKEAVKEVFEAMKKEAEQQKDKNQEPANKDEDDATTATSHRTQEILQSTEEALNIPVLPRARAVAQELMDIVDEADRWDLISGVWLEMLFYTAPRCGAAFHYEHLSTGGEFISHVLLLMRCLGPFLPKPGA